MLAPRSFPSRSILMLSGLILAMGLGRPAVTLAQAPKEGGIFVTVPNPLTGTAVDAIKRYIEKARNQPGTRLTKVVFDFNPGEQDSATRDYGVCDSLATYIHDELRLTHGVRAIAFVHKKVNGHTVLPVLACDDLVMAESASIGEVIEQNAPLPPPHHIEFYKRLAGRERQAVVMKMIDKNVEVVAGLEGGNTIYVDIAKVGVKGGEFETVTVSQKSKENPVLPRGDIRSYNLQQAMRFRLCRTSANSRQAVEQLYEVQQLIVDPLGGERAKAVRIDLIGPINDAMVARLKDQLKEVRNRKENLVFFNFECGGGDPAAANEAAELISKLEREDKKVIHTIAFIPGRAPDLSLYLALACKEIVMYRHRDAEAKREVDANQDWESVLGDFEEYLKNLGKNRDGENTLNVIRQQLLDLAASRDIDPLLIEGLLNPKEIIHYVRNTVGEHRFMTQAQFDEANRKAKKQEWTIVKTVKQAGKLLRLDTTRARDFRITQQFVESPDISEAYKIYGLQEKDIRDSKPSWINSFANFLMRIEITILLIIIGTAALILEVKMPGATVPGLIALLCFVLFFWSRAYVNGMVVAYAIILFAIGIVCLALEVFVLPGFGIMGVSGILLILGGIGLATLDRAPSTSDEWTFFAVRVMQYGLAMVGAGIVAFAVGRYLPKVPYANRLMLMPPSEATDGGDGLPSLPGAEQAASLLGQVGVATSTLRPAGMARFGDHFVDVVTEGDYIEPGTPIQVIEVEGTRIVVKRV